ncbi:post-GPI attachment to proteins factor 3-like isoform X1 [Centruroides sculpturatus]|uniref:post-GPI attachment to proteins factor 3-like isoform X1 n=1 Tax=Centruroides sculpturatus TaxID=218467 RepID=UPI000C6DE4CF|nr:post-GPI attachment to proteins factor 3-like isoform X1 [Centruroides sculpturatus]
MFRYVFCCFSILYALAVSFSLVGIVKASSGDRSDIYQSCLKWCTAENCSDADNIAHFATHQSWHLTVLGWKCDDECEYQCMWDAVYDFRKRKQPIPQFHGKWPFIRILGIQEPASALFSVLNGYSHYYMWQKFTQAVPISSPNYVIWNIQAILSINAWIWSTAFHTRDTPATEKLDYFCAFSIVLYAFYCLVIRTFRNNYAWLSIVVSVPFLGYFFYHIYYLTFIHFDYGYNMKANIFIGVTNSIGWLFWCYKNRYKRYVWKCAISVVMVNILLLLELGDFPPWNFLLDAHALWHLGTIPLPFFWYWFLIDDCLYELANESKKK